MGTLLNLARIVPLSPSEKASYFPRSFYLSERFLYSGEEHPSSLQSEGRVLPPLASKALYWRLSLVCLALACNRPDVLGEFLWTHMPCIRHLLLMSISNRFEMPIAQTADIISRAPPSSSAYVVTSNGLQLHLKESCAEVVSGDMHSVQLAIEEVEKEIWDSLFVHGFRFQSQRSVGGFRDELLPEAGDHVAEGAEGS